MHSYVIIWQCSTHCTLIMTLQGLHGFHESGMPVFRQKPEFRPWQFIFRPYVSVFCVHVQIEILKIVFRPTHVFLLATLYECILVLHLACSKHALEIKCVDLVLWTLTNYSKRSWLNLHTCIHPYLSSNVIIKCKEHSEYLHM